LQPAHASSSTSTNTTTGGKRLRIGIDATCLGSNRGYGRFLRELLKPLIERSQSHEYILFLDEHTAEKAGPQQTRTVVIPTSAGQADAASATGRRGVSDMLRMGRAVAREGLDIMYFPSVYSYYPVLSRVPVVVGFHDTIAERYGEVVFPSLATRLAWQAKVALARLHSRGLITVSEWSRDSLAEVFGVPKDRIFVTPEAASDTFSVRHEAARKQDWLRARGLAEDLAYFIYVGGFNPHKNLHRIVEAFARCVSETPDRELGLILVGDHEADNFYADVDELRKDISARGLDAQVQFPGFVSDDDLRPLHEGALALLIPSLEEGFGLPAVEAAACGAPCIATRNSPLPQLLEGGGIFVDPHETDALSSAMISMATDEPMRARLAATALERANALTWEATADATRAALETIVSGRF
jgi:glycosyltransferase involved in cell wall biosynthesis